MFLTCCFSVSGFAQDNKISVEDIWLLGEFRQDYVSGLRSMNDGDHYTTLERDEEHQMIVKHSYKSGKVVDTLFSTRKRGLDYRVAGYAFSNDESRILLEANKESIYRHSTKENNYVYSFESDGIHTVGFEEKQSFATFSPDGNRLAYVHKNNLYIEDFTSGEVIKVTNDGKKNEIINGGTDWVYEEEFAFDKAFFWSPRGHFIAFYRFDETRVKDYNMQVFGGDLYPSDERFKYPKAGEENADVSLHVFSLEERASKILIETEKPEIEYFPRVKWTNDEQKLAVQVMNRHQNDLTIKLFDVVEGSDQNIYAEKSNTYVRVTDDWTFLDNGKVMIISSEKSGYNHLYTVNLKNKKVSSITTGNFDVTNFYGTNDKGDMLYFAAAGESPVRREIYSIKSNGKNKKKLSSEQGWNSAAFSKGSKYFINTHSSANSPNVITLHDASGRLIRTLKESKRLNEKLGEYDLATKEFFKFKNDAGDELNAWMMKPAKFDESAEYPVLITIYGGPGSQTVKDQWGGANYLWHQMLVQNGYIVVSVDNRGTGGRGAEFKKSTYKQLGKLELEDYISFSKYLKAQSYIDENRIGIWGWSFGGYMATLAITKGSEYFTTAIAVAPVTTWRFYDTIYTERYMQTPEENEDGYDENSPIHFADRLNGNYLLVHGTADDNVHFQNATEMISALVRADKDFDMHIYPDKNHGIYGGNTRNHLYRKMTHFLKENL